MIRKVSAKIHVKVWIDDEELEYLTQDAALEGKPFKNEQDAIYALVLQNVDVTGAKLRDVEIDFSSLS